MNIKGLSGIVTATPTPIKNGCIDAESVRDLARYLIDHGSSAIAPIGGTGEYVSLSDRQKLDMVRATIEAVDGAVPTIAGLIAPGLGEALESGKRLLDAGAHGLLVTTPFYVRPTQEGIIDYFKALSDNLDADLVLYEFPYRTGVSLTAETVNELAQTTRIVAMKACNADTGLQMRVLEAAGEKISILSGDEDVYPLHVAAGARGGLIASSCILPNVWNRIDAFAKTGKLGDALKLHSKIRAFLKLLFSEHNPGPLKAALRLVDRPCGEPLLPLRKASEATEAQLARLLPEMLALEASMK
ncbi:dihydrodipicolinate synthase family protein [Bradyrhizobium iriomotense]|uniref:4-hydroxy-tetrahydrodipicolinate synthase n=1 Tax=Bradyrhizobium iriomotense TaxID=441950 RepID=A0ABQ6AQV3_9BRAD|nr:dihydrodipicolinate synthase family protein [Bradyrhizobium iriomotense]GLR84642.1 4-hydroxy-tetrahydrodipicolinate synthase [Bradyrhizobium iriomotense]